MKVINKYADIYRVHELLITNSSQSLILEVLDMDKFDSLGPNYTIKNYLGLDIIFHEDDCRLLAARHNTPDLVDVNTFSIINTINNISKQKPKVFIYVDHKFMQIWELLEIPLVGDRLVFEDSYKGYIVQYRELKSKEINIYCREDK